ncbi:MAG TPA: polynucleotide adenylyltransferase PcnB, partial [Treponemataceae bacterium]|nr:polynucleotide adenylyltransferase PcnB [Treponemataceae bacterium]
KEAEEANIAELYGKTWTRVRHFVLPINPQRIELEFAIKKILQSYGIRVKKPKRIKKEKQVRMKKAENS